MFGNKNTKTKEAASNEPTVTVQKTDAREAWAEAKADRPYRSPLKGVDIFPIYQTPGWRRWGVSVHHSLKEIKHDGYFIKGFNKLVVGDEIEVFTTNQTEFARILYIVAKVDKENHIVKVVQLHGFELPQDTFDEE